MFQQWMDRIRSAEDWFSDLPDSVHLASAVIVATLIVVGIVLCLGTGIGFLINSAGYERSCGVIQAEYFTEGHTSTTTGYDGKPHTSSSPDRYEFEILTEDGTSDLINTDRQEFLYLEEGDKVCE